ncbi:MAG: Error-prone repair protein ImuA [Chitinophagaceae bacterium]|nr:Error-prone repair protein ImuA [Chitinophagaceae bacterium]
MREPNHDIISQLQQDILRMQGFKSSIRADGQHVQLGPINQAFPNNQFPIAAIHEFLAESTHQQSCSLGFVSGILSTLMNPDRVVLWISKDRTCFPPALPSFNIQPDKIIFIDLKKDKELLWTMEEALKCDALAAVVGEISDISFISSRRLQLAVEKSRVTGFVIRRQPRIVDANSFVSRWRISPLPSEPPTNLPGVGFARWKVELLKIKNGKPGAWDVEWRKGKFRIIQVPETVMLERKIV